MRRLLVVLGICAGLAGAQIATGTSAAPNSTTIVLSCERGVTEGFAFVELVSEANAPNGGAFAVVDVNCGSASGTKSQRVTVSGTTAWVRTDIFVFVGADGDFCPVNGDAPVRTTCDPTGSAGVKLTVR
jgi:hypothetical protein